uniref:Reverse transcriptase domain-containing protein n=1 Tax=Tanacetum cinerariifolium TaxID=118510 RepID=A0A6L2L6B6_TANCI|nr:reverse transcriptase domain-containing protein [Tanacetum cinerariifolium]
MTKLFIPYECNLTRSLLACLGVVDLCFTCSKIKAEHQRPSGLLQQPEIPEWKYERIAMDLVTKLPRTSSRHDSIWVCTVRITVWEKVSFTNPVGKIGEGQLIGHEIMQETTKKISQIKDRLKAACVVHFGKKGKLVPRYVGPFEITERISPVAYRLRLPQELNGVHDTFHVSNLMKCLADPTLQIPLEEIQVEAKLNFVEELVEIFEREIKKLKRSRILIVKVQ